MRTTAVIVLTFFFLQSHCAFSTVQGGRPDHDEIGYDALFSISALSLGNSVLVVVVVLSAPESLTLSGLNS